MAVGEADVLMGVDQARADTCLWAVDPSCISIITVTAYTANLAVFDDDRAVGKDGAVGSKNVAREPEGIVAGLEPASLTRVGLRSALVVTALWCDGIIFTPERR
jgi:hypothetical protein